ncbi:MAG: electron transfer flavoprotein subunit beta/FixA family protein [Desulfurococcales archaeon]|nr:electron transfer flavoprotein subunit beta/FixA family protein [Desulfurococcales archaeon]
MKPAPDVEKVRFDVRRGVVDRSSAELEINPFDLHALEAAVRIKESVGGIVTVISMAPSHAEPALRDALARGADRAILLSDRRFAGSDTLATSYTLASAIKKLGEFDLIICGEKSVDGDTGQVGPEVAEFLGIPHVSYVTEIKEVSNGFVTVASDFGVAYYLVRAELPALLSVTKEVNVPRKPKFKDLMKARKAEIEVWSADDLKDVLDLNRLGLEGSATRVVKAYYALEKGREGIKVKGDEGIRKIIDLLSSSGVI